MKDKREQIHTLSSEPDKFGDFFYKIWKFRALIWVFAKRDLKVKYSQTLLGLSWTLLQPLTALFIFTFFFGFLLNWETDGIKYPIYVLSGLLGWNYFSYIVNAGSLGLQESAQLIKKIYFPKSIIPLSKTLIALVELGISIILLIVLMFYYGQGVSWKIIFLPFILLFNTICALNVVFWISIFALKKRDLLHLVPFLLYFGIWFSPVFFDNTIIPQDYIFILDMNPISNVVQGWRWSLFDYGEFKLIWVLNFFIMLFLLVCALYLYNKKEGELVDHL